MKKPIPRPQPAPLSYGVTSVGTEGIWHAIKNFLTFFERGNVNPMSTKEAQRTAVTTVHRITDRQVEIMTATLCNAILQAGEITPQNVHEAPGHLIGAMITHVTRLNASILDANFGLSRPASSKDPG
ncbi:hypothetical protein [Burkholderia cenocepacia]|uniref:hypothetical protein n=1 Tax=Burkholderia cenocepacia TaxID=95486 RepID=UPI001F5BF7F5|nr:hypothetical protein [Burkholderia cenocepacia]